MAEERLMDDDKDKKYRIVVNKNGEEELVVEEGEKTEEEVFFDVPEVTADNEEEAVMTPEQLAAKRAQEEKERKERAERAVEFVDRAKKDLLSSRFATALEYLEEAEELDPENGEIYVTRLAAYTRNYTDYTQIKDAAESADGIKQYASAELKAEVLAKAQTALEGNVNSLRGRLNYLNKENEERKEERAKKFRKDRNIALILFFAAFAVMAGFAAGMGVCIPLIPTVPTNKYLIMVCVFGGLAFVALIGLAVAARLLNTATRRLRLNKRNTTTKLGRELLEEQERLKAFLAVCAALKVD